MDQKRTVVIVGAGASFELGLPLGDQLKDQIREVLTFSRERSGDDIVFEALGRAESNGGNYFPRRLQHIASRVADGMTQAISIDNYINDHRGNDEIAKCGKIGIARCILKGEQSSPLYIGRHDRERIDFTTTTKSWLNKFFQILTQNCSKEQLPGRFENLVFVVFNYDRCIEQFALHWIMQYHTLDKSEAAQIVAHLTFYHPYGQVGRLPWQPGAADQMIFGGDPSALSLHNISQQIKTFTEGTDEKDSQINSIRESLASASIVLFLGFGYIDLNLDLLFAPSTMCNPSTIIGTAYNISEFNLSMIRKRLSRMFSTANENIHVSNNLRCAELINDYSRALEATLGP